MDFARQAIAAAILVMVTMTLQCAGMTVLIHWARERTARLTSGLSPWLSSVLMIRFTAVIIVMHLLETVLWAGFYRLQCLPSWEASFYFSAATYSTVGYGDVVLPQVWRVMGPVESITGVLMCGMSVSALVAIAARLIATQEIFPPEQNPNAVKEMTMQVENAVVLEQGGQGLSL